MKYTPAPASSSGNMLELAGLLAFTPAVPCPDTPPVLAPPVLPLAPLAVLVFVGVAVWLVVFAAAGEFVTAPWLPKFTTNPELSKLNGLEIGMERPLFAVPAVAPAAPPAPPVRLGMPLKSEDIDII
jgi:hypothetical protein